MSTISETLRAIAAAAEGEHVYHGSDPAPLCASCNARLRLAELDFGGSSRGIRTARAFATVVEALKADQQASEHLKEHCGNALCGEYLVLAGRANNLRAEALTLVSGIVEGKVE